MTDKNYSPPAVKRQVYGFDLVAADSHRLPHTADFY